MDMPVTSPIPPSVSPAPSPLPPVRPPKRFPTGLLIGIFAIIVLVVLGVFLFPKISKIFKKSAAVTLTYWGLWETDAVIKPLIDQYQLDHPNVKINYIFQSPREYRERLQNALSSSKGPDIFRIHNTWIPMFKSDLSSVPPDIYSASDFESVFYPTTKSDLRMGGNYVAIPLEIDGLALYINDDLFSQGGKTVPTDWTQFRQTATDLCVGQTDDGKCKPGEKILIAGAALGTADNVDHWQDIISLLMLQNNVNLNSPSGKPAEDVLSFYASFSSSIHVWDSTLPNSTQAFAGGKLAMYFAPSWRVFDLQAINPQLKFSVHPLPQPPIDSSRGEQPITWATYWVEAVNKKSPYSKEAWDFIKFLSSSDSLQKLYKSSVDSGRAFGEPYALKSLSDTIASAPFVGPYIDQAVYARSWYLASNTWDGPTGLNTQLSKYFTDAINSTSQGQSASEALKTLSAGINQVLSRYGIVASTPAKTR